MRTLPAEPVQMGGCTGSTGEITDGVSAWAHQGCLLWLVLIAQWSSLCTGGNPLQDTGHITGPGVCFSWWLCSYPPPSSSTPHHVSNAFVSTACMLFLILLSVVRLDWKLFKAKTLEADWHFPHGQCQAFSVVTFITTTIESATASVECWEGRMESFWGHSGSAVTLVINFLTATSVKLSTTHDLVLILKV